MIKNDDNKRINQIDSDINYLKLEIARLELEKNINQLLLNINDSFIIEIIKNKYPQDYYLYVDSINLFNTYNIKIKSYDLNEKKETIIETYNIYNDLNTLLKEFYSLYMYVKYEDDDIYIQRK